MPKRWCGDIRRRVCAAARLPSSRVARRFMPALASWTHGYALAAKAWAPNLSGSCLPAVLCPASCTYLLACGGAGMGHEEKERRRKIRKSWPFGFHRTFVLAMLCASLSHTWLLLLREK